MAHWQFKLDLKDVYKSEDCVKIATVIVERGNALAAEIKARAKKEPIILLAKKLRRMATLLEQDVIPEFEEVAEVGDSENYDSFNYAMDDLYDWADASLDDEWSGKKMCWVETF